MLCYEFDLVNLRKVFFNLSAKTPSSVLHYVIFALQKRTKENKLNQFKFHVSKISAEKTFLFSETISRSGKEVAVLFRCTIT